MSAHDHLNHHQFAGHAGAGLAMMAVAANVVGHAPVEDVPHIETNPGIVRVQTDKIGKKRDFLNSGKIHVNKWQL